MQTNSPTQRGLRAAFRLRQSLNPGKDVLRRVGSKVGDKLIVNCQIRRKDEEVIDALRKVQITDKRTHEAGFPDSSSQRKAKGRKIPLEVRNRRKLAPDRRQCGSYVYLFFRRYNLRDPVKNLQGSALGPAQTQTAGNRVDVTVH
jgi:hypothetical protein